MRVGEVIGLRKGHALMSQVPEQLKADLLRLPTADRAELAYFLIRSLDQADEGVIQADWEAELERRWQDMEI